MTAAKPETMSATEARHLALAAQGLATPRPAKADKRALAKMIDRLGVVQIDSVNVLQRSHYLPAWSRLGAYDTTALDNMAYRAPRTLFEYWGHEASLLPVELWPLLRWRMNSADKHAWGMVRRAGKRRAMLDQVLAMVTERGPIGAGDLEVAPARAKKTGWWGWSDAKRAIEWLFYTGAVTTASRKNFERLYDLPERVLPKAIFEAPPPSEADACRTLVERAARALGVATEVDLRDYYRLRTRAKAAIADLVEAGTLVPTTIEGWAKPAYRHRAARLSAIDSTRTTLLSPFDSLVWTRDRTERIFGMRYRLEIYTPAEKRVHGYYVLPFLLGDRLVARVDLKADRANCTLLVQAAHAESHAPPASIAAPLAAELSALAAWLSLDSVTVVGAQTLAQALAQAQARALL